MGNNFLTMSESPHIIRGKVNKYIKVKMEKKNLSNDKTQKLYVKRQMIKREKDLQFIAQKVNILNI